MLVSRSFLPKMKTWPQLSACPGSTGRYDRGGGRPGQECENGSDRECMDTAYIC